MSNQVSYQLQVHVKERKGYEEIDVQNMMMSDQVNCQLQEVGVKEKMGSEENEVQKEMRFGEWEGAVEQNESEDHIQPPSHSPRWQTQPPKI